MEFRSDMTVKLVQSMGSDRSIVAAAKVSTQGPASLEEFDKEAAAGLINFLMKNRHGTPFEHGAMTFFIQAPIFVFREFHRHRIGWSYNEESGRYKQLEPIFYVPSQERDLMQVGSAGHYDYRPGTADQYVVVEAEIRVQSETAYQAYERLLQEGIAREVARMVLPVNIYSSMYATCNPRSLMAFLSLRTKYLNAYFPSFPMREIELVANQMEAWFDELFPVTFQSFCSNGRVCP